MPAKKQGPERSARDRVTLADTHRYLGEMWFDKWKLVLYISNMTSQSSLFVPFKNKRAFEEIVDQIRSLIYSGTFKPGYKLPSEIRFS